MPGPVLGECVLCALAHERIWHLLLLLPKATEIRGLKKGCGGAAWQCSVEGVPGFHLAPTESLRYHLQASFKPMATLSFAETLLLMSSNFLPLSSTPWITHTLVFPQRFIEFLWPGGCWAGGRMQQATWTQCCRCEACSLGGGTESNRTITEHLTAGRAGALRTKSRRA